MLSVLQYLPNPFRGNLLSTDKACTPFEIFIPGNANREPLGPPVHNKHWLANLGIGVVTLSRCVGSGFVTFIGVITLLPSWSATPLANSCKSFPCSGGSVITLLAFFGTQIGISYWFSFLHATSSKTVWCAYVGMLTLCLLDAITTAATGYYAVCILDSSEYFGNNETMGARRFLNCRDDFGANFSVDWSAKHGDEQGELYFNISAFALALFGVRLLVQTFAFARRRMIGADCDERTAPQRDSVPQRRDPRIPVAEVPEPTTALINGCLHGWFLLCALFPHDLPKLLNGRWSPIQMQPHWTNALVQLIILVEKTAMGFLVLDLLVLEPPEADSGGARYAVGWLFGIQCAIQMVAFVYVQVVRPGRTGRVERGDHLLQEIQRVQPLDKPASARCCTTSSRAIMEVREIWVLPEHDGSNSGAATAAATAAAAAAADSTDDNNGNGFHYCVANSTGTARSLVCGCQLRANDPAISTPLNQRGTGALIAVVSGATSTAKHSNFDHPERAVSTSWSLLVLFLAFLDWFHVAYNLMNLKFLIGAQLHQPPSLWSLSGVFLSSSILIVFWVFSSASRF